MRHLVPILALGVLQVVKGLGVLDTDFCLDYFKGRSVKLVCLHVCDDKWTRNFTNKASKIPLLVSAIHKEFNEGALSSASDCLRSDVSIGVVADPSCGTFERFMYYASQNTLLDSTRKWLVLSEENTSQTSTSAGKGRINTSNGFDTLSKLNFSIDADITVAVRKGSKRYQLHGVYKIGNPNGRLIYEKSGRWDYEKGLTTNLNEYKYYRRWNFQQWPIRMISVVFPAPKVFDPKMLTDLSPTPGVAVITKTAVSIMNVIAEVHNLRFVHSTADRWLDDFNENNTQVVVGSSLYYRHQDVSPIIRFMKEVYDKIDILHPPLTSIETRYFYRIPTHGAGKFENQFLRPLSAGAWLCVAAVIVLCAVALFISAKFERRPSSTQYAVFSVIASFCQQFFEDNTDGQRKTSTARKLAVLVTGISCVLIYNYYTSSVVSWLLNGPPPSINSLQELLESPLELIYEDIGYTNSWLQTPSYYFNKRNAKIEDEIRKKKVFNKNKDAPLLVSLEDGIKMVKNGGFAYHTELDTANLLISRMFTQSELCELGSLQSMDKTLLYACVPKNSSYKEFFVWSLIRLSERGIMKCVERRTSSPPVSCEGSSPRALALGGAAPAFILLISGYTLAVVIMLIERKIWKYKQENQKSQRKF